MPFYTYILFSKKLNRFYTGSTILSPDERLNQHLANHYGNTAFTSAAQDWEIEVAIECETIDQARKIEKHIKSMKSKKYIQNLKLYPDLVQKLLSKYQ